MDEQAKKTALRMIPYGLFVLTAQNEAGRIGTATVNWVTQASFKPPLVVVCVKRDSNVHDIIEEQGAFALNVLGKRQAEIAYKFFRPAQVESGMLSGEPYQVGETGSPILTRSLAFLECEWVSGLYEGDHSVFLGRVVAAGVHEQPSGRPDASTLLLQDLEGDIFYGG